MERHCRSDFICGEGDDTLVVEDTSGEDDGEMLQERFQLR
jgi:hypothetical protein